MDCPPTEVEHQSLVEASALTATRHHSATDVRGLLRTSTSFYASLQGRQPALPEISRVTPVVTLARFWLAANQTKKALSD